jgi:Cdc6-like AAA superfamily ATPase
MDELDYLLTRDFKVIYNFFDWPMQQEGFLLVGIANTMNLPETISAR